ncbi:hypothetical protein [Alicyclobacillus ferrooxydans]|uniref:Uncharacterized protein n=1 Tax=Alicyclobacillus ferrooxydans TaxID=471514 RepID=A0A0P9CD72_9BACL|nr:hypothetical protein [Alicyclobacillus ferrooxydans]KPV43676.1 hypothetical protein AN477_10910 [Alicyclobacillus ferrooxydans]
MRVDGDLDQLWDWCLRRVTVLDFVPQGGSSKHTGYLIHRTDGASHPDPDAPGWFWSAYPVLSPYYPVPSVSPEWIDAWSMQDFQGFWW